MSDLHQSLSEDELSRLDSILLDYGNDDSILSVSELEGFLTALISSPEPELPSEWISWVWGGEARKPRWASESQAADFYKLLFRFQNNIAAVLMDTPEAFQPLLMVNNAIDDEIFIAEEWCFGYLRGVDSMSWPAPPPALESWMFAIELHGRESNFELLETLTLEEYQTTVHDIGEAAVRLFQYYRFGLIDGATVVSGMTRSEKIGRNSPCPCGSGKKYKQCCLS